MAVRVSWRELRKLKVTEYDFWKWSGDAGVGSKYELGYNHISQGPYPVPDTDRGHRAQVLSWLGPPRLTTVILRTSKKKVVGP
ncbi:hypothetical protein PPACK8108_LOCUS4158 [Phakopsora pachyrhizi]|uniref:Uncharacterized protein n=1 Tax=Phakopsora pachyrhizi TaxID=170000 RepID=A0AAV0AN44_PHAPC|nr:hypothetical protein PPACK8108_LOCUS4158 [Phakopsora pachyrhizi]